MLSADEQNYLNSLSGEEAGRIVRVRPYNSAVVDVTEEILHKLHQLVPNAKIKSLGSSALGISGQNDIAIYILVPAADHIKYLPVLESLLEKHDRYRWHWYEKGFEVTVYLSDPETSTQKKQIEVFDALKNNAELLKKYEQLKLSLDGKTYREYQIAKYEFYHSMLGSEAREIERHPLMPALTPVLIQLLSLLCFRPDDSVEPVDLIFVFASIVGVNQIADMVKNLLEQKVSQKVFIAGGIPDYDDIVEPSKPESELVLNRIHPDVFPTIQFFTEDKSTNTLGNVAEALKVLDFSAYPKILFIFKKHGPRRAYLTLRRFLPNAKIIQQTYSPMHEGADMPIEIDNWYTCDFGRTRVWGEYLRIKRYGERGDIAYDEQTKFLVDKISEMTN